MGCLYFLPQVMVNLRRRNEGTFCDVFIWWNTNKVGKIQLHGQDLEDPKYSAPSKWHVSRLLSPVANCRDYRLNKVNKIFCFHGS